MRIVSIHALLPFWLTLSARRGVVSQHPNPPPHVLFPGVEHTNSSCIVRHASRCCPHHHLLCCWPVDNCRAHPFLTLSALCDKRKNCVISRKQASKLWHVIAFPDGTRKAGARPRPRPQSPSQCNWGFLIENLFLLCISVVCDVPFFFKSRLDYVRTSTASFSRFPCRPPKIISPARSNSPLQNYSNHLQL